MSNISLFSTASPLFFRISAMVTTVAMAERGISGVRINCIILEQLHQKSILNRIFKIFSALSPKAKKIFNEFDLIYLTTKFLEHINSASWTPIIMLCKLVFMNNKYQCSWVTYALP